jgi:isopropylmalate/homocitrate/citramalate synthase
MTGSGAPVLRITEVGPRDGLQNDAAVLEPGVRATLSRMLSTTGVSRVEAGSFVHPQRVPQMAGADELFAVLGDERAVPYAALVLNQKGLDRALAAGADVINVVYPVTEAFCQRNQNTSLPQAAATAATLIRSAREAGKTVSATLGASFGCPFEGRVDPGVVVEHVRHVAAAGAHEVVLADTIGVAVPSQVRQLVPAAFAATGGLPVGLHLHNTRNTGYANAAEALQHGISVLDSSVGGLGGCPFAPRATGNIATEDLVYLLDGEGVQHGVDLDAVMHVAEWLTGILGRELPGLLHRAGRFP